MKHILKGIINNINDSQEEKSDNRVKAVTKLLERINFIYSIDKEKLYPKKIEEKIEEEIEEEIEKENEQEITKEKIAFSSHNNLLSNMLILIQEFRDNFIINKKY